MPRCPVSEAEIENDLSTNWLGDNEYQKMVEDAADKLEKSHSSMYVVAESLINEGFEHQLATFLTLANANPEECLVWLRNLARREAEKLASQYIDEGRDCSTTAATDVTMLENWAMAACGIPEGEA